MPSCGDSTTIKESIAAVVSVYADLDKIDAPRSCVGRSTCCHFRLTGRTPVLTAGEALVAAKGLRATGRTALPASSDERTGRCPMLGENDRCMIYMHRPFGCRTHFCAAAGGPYPRRTVRHLIQRLESIAEQLCDPDPRAIESAIRRALAKWF